MKNQNQAIRLPEHFWDIYPGENNFFTKASEYCKNDWQGFLEDHSRWCKHINANEPELLFYVSKPEGPLLLSEWFKRMDCTSMREEWMKMSSAEKNLFLKEFYYRTQKIISLSKRIDNFFAQTAMLRQKKHYHDELQLIKPLIEDFEHLDYIKETDNIEYYDIEDVVEINLWKNLPRHKKQVRFSYLSVTYLYHCYGWLLCKCGLYQEAGLALKTAYNWNPASSQIIFKLAETFSDEELDVFYELLKHIHKFCYTKEKLAECYRGFTHVFVRKQKYKDALCCYKIGRCYNDDPDYMNSELSEITEALDGRLPDVTIEDVLKSSENNDYSIGVNRDIFHIASHCGNELLKHGDEKHADCFFSIMNEFFDNQEAKDKYMVR